MAVLAKSPRTFRSPTRTRPAPTQRGQLALAPARRLPRESGAKATPPALATSMQLPTAKPINQRPTALGARRSVVSPGLALRLNLRRAPARGSAQTTAHGHFRSCLKPSTTTAGRRPMRVSAGGRMVTEPELASQLAVPRLPPTPDGSCAFSPLAYCIIYMPAGRASGDDDPVPIRHQLS